MTVVDAHHHFWDPARASYPWMTDELAAIRRPFGPDDLEPLLEAAGVERTLLVQTRSSLDETREFLATAEAHDFVAGVVGWVDLEAASVTDALDNLRSGAGGGRLVGVRHQVHDEPDPDWLSRPAVRRGLGAIEAAGLTYDLLVRTRELPAAVAAARAMPALALVLDHAAKPPIATGKLERWRRELRPLARLPNVWCKLSGLVTEASGTDWTVADLRPCRDVLLEMFGPRRLIFGSDWPVCLIASSYARWWAAAHALVADLTVTEQADVFGDAAKAAYPLMALR